MDISYLVPPAVETLQLRESTGKTVTSVTVEPVRDEAGWISYADTARLTYHDGTPRSLSICGTPLAAVLERHADDEAELGTVPAVVIPVPVPHVTPGNRVRCEEHPGVHPEGIACRWPHNVTADGEWPQVGHPCRVTD